MSRGGRRWGWDRGGRGHRGGRGNRGRGSGRRGSWHRDGQERQEIKEHEVDADGFLVPQLAWKKRRNNNRRGNRSRRFNGRNYCPRVFIDPEVLKEARRCTECRAEDAPYRCPACLKKYCSVPCFKSHKSGINCAPTITSPVDADLSNENSMEAENSGEPKIQANRRKPAVTKKYLYPTKDTVSLEGLEKLNKEPLRDTMVEMFQSETLRAKIRTLDSSEQPGVLLNQYMQHPEFSKFSEVVVDALSDELVQKLGFRNRSN